MCADGVRFRTPGGTNLARTPAKFREALSSVQHLGLAVITFPAVGYDSVTNEVAEATAILKQCGFSEVRAVVTGWGMTFPYSAQ